MARIDWVKRRLDNWALWRQRQEGGGLGFATQSSFLRERYDCDRYREANVPVDEVEASTTDLGVEGLKLGHGHLHKTLHHIYIDNLGVKETARRMGRAESTIKAQLEQADALLARWFSDRARMAADQRARLKAVAETARP